MTQPLDPTLNVPSSPDIPIEQIPYQTIPFPFADLTDQTQPSLAQYYPDNIPPTLSTIAAMNPNAKAGQTLHTDGNHALLVSSVGGGASAPAINHVDTFFQEPFFGNKLIGSITGPLPVILGAVISGVVFVTGSYSLDKAIEILLSNSDASKAFRLYDVPIRMDPAASGIWEPYSIYIPFPSGLDLSLFMSGETTWGIWVSTEGEGASVNVTLHSHY